MGAVRRVEPFSTSMGKQWDRLHGSLCSLQLLKEALKGRMGEAPSSPV